MTAPLVIPMPGNDSMAQSLAHALDAEVGQFECRSFPDGETYLRFPGDVAGRGLIIVCTLDRPNPRVLPLLFAAATARELGAARVGLVAPYLSYMRQDRRFKAGEAVTSRHAARILSDAFDWLVTIDPHLHRYDSLADIYRIPAQVAHAAPLLARWIKANVENPIIVGPDSESEQWVSAVARDAAAPFTVMEKVRHGDRDVEISIKDIGSTGGHTPVLVDDIISSGRTMLAAVRLLASHVAGPPVCLAVHGIFADRSDFLLTQAGARIFTSNTIAHTTNAIDVTGMLAEAVDRVM